MKTILVTGGAGYIGSAAVKKLIEKSHNVVVIDNLSHGRRELVDDNAKFYELDLGGDIGKVFIENEIDAVMHFAAYKSIGESMRDTAKYSENISGTLNLLNNMVKFGVKRIIFSSSASVYGNCTDMPISEDAQINQTSYYGHTKIACEQLIEWYSRIHGIGYTNLRYFNIIGDAGLGYIDPKAEDVLSLMMETLIGKRDGFTIMGDDYDTRDGTGIRDYIDINDLIDAHMLAFDTKESGVINLGTSEGVSVIELVRTMEEVTGKKLDYTIGERRKGDISVSIASNSKAKKVLGWEPKVGVKKSVESVWDCYSPLQ